MSPEEVKAAREAMKQRLAGNAKPEPAPEPEPEAEIKSGPVILNEDMRQFDTTKLDLSKIMGMDDELSRTFEMIDSIDEDKSSESEEKGGER
jgi:hypothetical protein